MRPFALVQVSDPHIGADWGGGNPIELLSAVVASVREAVPKPEAVLVSGDLADHGEDAEYEKVRDLLAPLGAPLYVVAGNHDDRSALRRHFGVGGDAEAPLQYSVDLGPLRLVVLDSARRGIDPGELGADRLAWLESTLGADSSTPTLLALHHPPVVTGIPAYDKANLPSGDCEALARVVARHPQVRLIVAGHAHRMIASDVGGRRVLVVPSTYAQGRLEFDAEGVSMSDDPPAFAVHSLVGGRLVSHLQPVAPRAVTDRSAAV